MLLECVTMYYSKEKNTDMNKFAFFCYATIFAVGVFAIQSAWAGSENDLYSRLRSRETSLNNKKFEWVNAERFALIPVPLDQQLAKSQFSALLAKKAAAKQGIIGAEQTKNFISEMLQNDKALDAGYSVDSSAKWEFQSDIKQTMVTGSSENNVMLSHYRCYLGKKERLNVSDGITAKSSHQAILDDPAEVYLTPGEAWRYRNPTERGLIFTPEDLSLLAGRNPLAMYNAKWKSVCDSNRKQTFKAVVERGEYAPYTVNVTLDKLHGYCPSEINFNSKRRHEHYQVSDWLAIDNNWMPKQVNFTLDRQPRWRMERTWKLVATEKAQPIKVELSEDTDFIDYRLLGTELTTSTALNAILKGDPNVVKYQFRGVAYDMPSLSKLKEIKNLIHPGESSPDNPRSSSMTPFLGGMLCIVGGVWMFRRRGES